MIDSYCQQCKRYTIQDVSGPLSHADIYGPGYRQVITQYVHLTCSECLAKEQWTIKPMPHPVFGGWGATEYPIDLPMLIHQEDYLAENTVIPLFIVRGK